MVALLLVVRMLCGSCVDPRRSARFKPHRGRQRFGAYHFPAWELRRCVLRNSRLLRATYASSPVGIARTGTVWPANSSGAYLADGRLARVLTVVRPIRAPPTTARAAGGRHRSSRCWSTRCVTGADGDRPPRLDHARVQKPANGAKQNCSLSKLLNEEITPRPTACCRLDCPRRKYIIAVGKGIPLWRQLAGRTRSSSAAATMAWSAPGTSPGQA